MVISIFYFSHNIFKKPLSQSRKKSGLCGKKVRPIVKKNRTVLHQDQSTYFVLSDLDLYCSTVMRLVKFLPHNPDF